ncbi:ROK family protein [Bradyrhizobium sp. CER78]|uniref:ROK family protein n=1 Tax=Bradyrhizobium sp. CER78 TaxID=3039162 RepID=UPI0024476FE7|nr:ROK family protein [Bradyrhizobium sp. CER78]MDH2384063.1 ROK family protein [Bradyrhizobium sp. CER78]
MNEQSEPLRRASSLTRGSNRDRLVEVLRRQGPLPRVELARSTGLSFPAISAITSKLMAEDLLVEAETDAATSWPDDTDDEDADGVNGRRRGRPAVLLTLNPEFGRIIAVSLRMNLIETLIADFSGSALAQSRLELTTRGLDAGAVCDLVIAQIEAMLEETGTPRDRLLGIGIALQGIVDADTGRHLWSPALSITDVDLAKPIREEFGVEVVMANDAVAVALALVAAEPALAQGLTATLMVGHGIGMGIVVDGEARWGAGAGSEIGHVKLTPNGPQCRCGQRGCIEAHLADYALYRDARTFLDLPPAVSQQPSEAQMALLRARARAGDPRLEQLFRQAGHALAEAVATTISVLRPHHLILAGPGLQAFDMMRSAYEERLEQAALPWLLKSTAIHVRPSESATIVDGMVRRTLRVVDRSHMETTE